MQVTVSQKRVDCLKTLGTLASVVFLKQILIGICSASRYCAEC